MKQGNIHPTIYFWNYTAISRFAWICICASSAWAVWIRNRMANPSTDVKKSKRFWLLPWSYFSQSDLDVYHIILLLLPLLLIISDGVRPGKPSGFILKCWSQDDTFLNDLLKKDVCDFPDILRHHLWCDIPWCDRWRNLPGSSCPVYSYAGLSWRKIACL